MKLIYLLSLLLYTVSAATDYPKHPTLSSNTQDWKLESISIIKSEEPKELLQYHGDYIVVAKFRNKSKRSIKVATNHSNTYICDNQLSSDEWIAYTKERNRIYHISCHPPTIALIAPDEIYTISCRNSSKYEGKKMSLSAGHGTDAVIFGIYTLKPTKMPSIKLKEQH